MSAFIYFQMASLKNTNTDSSQRKMTLDMDNSI